jgi:hypothetical protein
VYAVERQVCDRHAVGRSACRRAVLVVLLDDDAVVADVGERDVLVGHVGDGAGRFIDGLDAHTVFGVGHGRGGDGDAFYGVIAAAADGAVGEAVPAGAVAICEGDALFKELDDIVGRRQGTHSSGVDSEAVILVLDIRSGNGNAGTAANIEGICVFGAQNCLQRNRQW